jgi:hypothetical protein
MAAGIKTGRLVLGALAGSAAAAGAASGAGYLAGRAQRKRAKATADTEVKRRSARNTGIWGPAGYAYNRGKYAGRGAVRGNRSQRNALIGNLAGGSLAGYLAHRLTSNRTAAAAGSAGTGAASAG